MGCALAKGFCIMIPMNLSRLSGRKVCDHVMRKGKVWKGKMMVAHLLPGAPRNATSSKPAIYFGSFASARLSKSAVERNRMRRRCREALRLELQPLTCSGSIQLLLTPRSASLKAQFEDILADAHSLLSLLPCQTPSHAPDSSSTR